MNLWTAIVLIVLAGSAVEIVKIYSRRSSKQQPELLRQLEELKQRLGRQEKRIANLETLVLDRETERSFDEVSR